MGQKYFTYKKGRPTYILMNYSLIMAPALNLEFQLQSAHAVYNIIYYGYWIIEMVIIYNWFLIKTFIIYLQYDSCGIMGDRAALTDRGYLHNSFIITWLLLSYGDWFNWVFFFIIELSR